MTTVSGNEKYIRNKDKNTRKVVEKIPPAEPPMISPAAQAAEASGSSKGAPLFVAANLDLVAKTGVEMDSWFFVSHLTSGGDRLDLLVHYMRLTPKEGEPVVQAMASVLDPSGEFVVEERNYRASETTLSTASLNVQTPSGGVTGHTSAMHVTACFQRININLTLAHQGPLLADLGTGIVPFYGDINYEYALPNMATSGSVMVDGKSYQVAGTSWFDRQWGRMGPSFLHKKWTWMGICLDNGIRISLSDIFEGDQEHAFATALHPDGRHEIVDVEPLAEGSTSIWNSAATGRRYPTKWVVSIPMLKARLCVEPFAREQEVVSPIGEHKYEGASSVVGHIEDKPVRGHAIVELVGDWN